MEVATEQMIREGEGDNDQESHTPGTLDQTVTVSDSAGRQEARSSFTTEFISTRTTTCSHSQLWPLDETEIPHHQQSTYQGMHNGLLSSPTYNSALHPTVVYRRSEQDVQTVPRRHPPRIRLRRPTSGT